MPHPRFERGVRKTISPANRSGGATSTIPWRNPILRIVSFPAIVFFVAHLLEVDYKTIPSASLLIGLGETQSKSIAPILSHKNTTDKKWPLEFTIGQMHHPEIEVLGLLDWEMDSLKGITEDTDWPNDEIRNQKVGGSCHPPNGIQQSCCLGSFSAGGEVEAKERHICQLPLQRQLPDVERSSHDFFRQNPLSGSTDNTACDVCRIVELCRQHNLTVAFVGDSMHRQIVDGFDCELGRRNYRVESETQHHPPCQRGIFQRNHVSTNTMTIRSPQWPENATVTMKFHMIYMVPLNVGCGNWSALTAEADVLVLGFGLHWWYKGSPLINGEDEYAVDMSKAYTEIKNQGHVRLLVHRETSAQHFDANGGEFFIWKNDPNHTMECRQFRLEDESVYWREKLISRAAELAGLQLIQAGPTMPPYPGNHGNKLTELVSLPYFYFTAQFANMHPINYKPGVWFIDCTHYCSSPFIYYPLWRSLRFAMDRRFASG